MVDYKVTYIHAAQLLAMYMDLKQKAIYCPAPWQFTLEPALYTQQPKDKPKYLCLLVYIGVMGVNQLSYKRQVATIGSKVHHSQAIL